MQWARALMALVAKHAARHDHAEWRLAALHLADLHGTRVGAEQEVRIALDEKGVLHVPGRMFLRKIQTREHVPIVFNFRPVRHGEAHPVENGQDLPAAQC